ncbi:MAG: class I SAM-dependent methyltransferase [Deltaproteobacteria bacterium]|jgi:SAM-dependent methyltransferase|nr:class I SAM-dependent methyltransferase [Deltaproteobacteria bacterium]
MTPPTITRRRFFHLSRPVDYLPSILADSPANSPVSPRARERAYPVRAVRYWLTRELLAAELAGLGRGGEIKLAELGCHRGFVKFFTKDLTAHVEWVGLDNNRSFEHEALAAGVEAFVEADFNDPLPLASSSVDIVLFSHVVEHLANPAFTLAEISRALKPGGLLIAGSPVLPWPLSFFREKIFQARLRNNKITPGDHIHAFSPGKWRSLLDAACLDAEFLSGGFLFRATKSPLEDSALWFRFNMVWGALFPSLGNEIFITARKPLPVFDMEKQLKRTLEKTVDPLGKTGT